MSLISKEDLLKKFESGALLFQPDIRKIIVSEPEAIVRCKDCKHNSLKRMSGNTYCDLGIGLFQLYDFCSLGERRTDA